MLTPLKVTAHLAAGYVSYEPWVPMLDGVLAYAALREQLPAQQFQNPDNLQLLIDPALPLAKYYSGGEWVWACSMPKPEGVVREALQHTNKRFDTQLAERYADCGKRKIIATNMGPYKSHRTPVRVISCRAVSWHVLGEAAELRRLLSGVEYLGKRRGAGLGQVLSWSVEPEQDDCSVLVDGVLQRPVPWSPDLEARVLAGSWYSADLGIRPPYWHLGRIRACMLPVLAQA